MLVSRAGGPPGRLAGLHWLRCLGVNWLSGVGWCLGVNWLSGVGWAEILMWLYVVMWCVLYYV